MVTTRKLKRLAFGVGLFAALGASVGHERSAAAQPAPPGDTLQTRLGVRHTPPGEIVRGEPLVIEVSFANDETIERTWLVYRTPERPALRQVLLTARSEGRYQATVPPEDTGSSVVEYTLEIQEVGRQRRALYASRESLETVRVVDAPEKSPPRAPDGSAAAPGEEPPDRTGDPAAGQAEPRRAPPTPVGEPTAHHAPLSAVPAGEPVVLRVDLARPDRIAKAWVVFRTPVHPELRQVELHRASPGPFETVIPGDEVAAPDIAYCIEVEELDGRRYPVFGSRDAPKAVQVLEASLDLIGRTFAAGFDDRRSLFIGSFDWVSFGKSEATTPGPDGLPRVETVQDQYYRVEGGYTYRPFYVVSEFGVRLGVVRGKAPVPVRELLPEQSEDERFDVGLNYALSYVRFRIADLFHTDSSFLLNVAELGFSVGGGGTLHIGDLRGTKLALGFEGVQHFGLRFFSQLDVRPDEAVRISPIIEVSNMPSADSYGVRLLAEVGVDFGLGIQAAARVGYQARNFASGGATLGGSFGYGF
ncbi:MAG: hypothetical protein HY908_30835 [Myxococcales bacterium]|nr:hypothetical protein [Myxococcales bacterium]